MPVPAILRPDAKGRVGLGSFTKRLEERFHGRPISGYAAALTEDGNILLSPKVEIDADTASILVLGDADRDAFLNALENPSAPNDRLKAALERHEAEVK